MWQGALAQSSEHTADPQLLSKMGRIDQELVASGGILGTEDRSALTLDSVKAVLNQVFPVRLGL